MCHPYFWNNIVFKCTPEQYRNGKHWWRNNSSILSCWSACGFCCCFVGFSLNIHSFCEMCYFSWKRKKGNPGAWSSDRWNWMYRYFFVNLSPLFINCYWILVRYHSKSFGILPPLFIKVLCFSMLEVLNCKSCFSWGEKSGHLLVSRVQRCRWPGTQSSPPSQALSSSSTASPKAEKGVAMSGHVGSTGSVWNYEEIYKNRLKLILCFIIHSSVWTDYIESKIKCVLQFQTQTKTDGLLFSISLPDGRWICIPSNFLRVCGGFI